MLQHLYYEYLFDYKVAFLLYKLYLFLGIKFRL